MRPTARLKSASARAGIGGKGGLAVPLAPPPAAPFAPPTAPFAAPAAAPPGTALPEPSAPPLFGEPAAALDVAPSAESEARSDFVGALLHAASTSTRQATSAPRARCRRKRRLSRAPR